ncbi:hypothetical protein BI364_09435 [Acidihalobacter yilgarnensis]|uniref:Uncharacterized protein n=1 Tax=Acidihalobacter yilgarnensis TaxID=2819280 RepID=A0A1D8INT8_9GAMM|nr:hypothetical protein [Acidihalobacter yilgarnensis]AOU98148.1 hypothetical protein BI364_09435 [Acidihalobacter yilgarnensis]
MATENPTTAAGAVNMESVQRRPTIQFPLSGSELVLSTYGALENVVELLGAAAPIGYSKKLMCHVYGPDRRGAKTAAGWLADAGDQALNGLKAIGFVLSALGSDSIESHGDQLMGIGNAITALSVIAQKSREGASELEHYAEQLKSAGVDFVEPDA